MNDIVIIGGGTAGWMAAVSIASRFPQKKVTIVDPKLIGPIGVGESVDDLAPFTARDFARAVVGLGD